MQVAGRFDAVLTLAVAAGLAGAGCDWLGDRFKTCQDAFVDLVNGDQSREAVDIVADGEDPGPQTPLEPGQARRVSYCLSKGDRRGFRVLREGVVLADAVCVASRSTYEGRAVQVRWGPAGLACSGW
jgi:hypothetical protein